MSSSAKIITIQSLPTKLSTNSAYDFVCQAFCNRFVRDRFNVLNEYSSINWVDTVDTLPVASSTPIADIMDARATELIKKGSIAAQWSGGVDSTALVLSLIKNGISKEDLVICYDTNSVEEYPKLFVWFQENGWNIKKCTDWYKELSTIDTDLITNGWCADQLFGSVYFHNHPECYSYSLEDFMSKGVFKDWNPSEKQIPEFAEIYKKYAKDLLGVELTTAAELGWFINFVMKWTWVSKFNDLWLLESNNKDKTQVFYNTQEFQSWSLGNYEEINKHNIYGDDSTYYKKPLKDYCNSVFPDEYYLLNKSKKPSWNSTMNRSMYKRRFICIETTEGFDVHNLKNAVTSDERWNTALEQIFTSIQK